MNANDNLKSEKGVIYNIEKIGSFNSRICNLIASHDQRHRANKSLSYCFYSRLKPVLKNRSYVLALLREFIFLFLFTFSALASLSLVVMVHLGAGAVGFAAAHRQVAISGDILLGGLFPIHEGGRNASQCGRIKADQGVQRMVAMLFALDSINRDDSILPGIRLGAQILDTCSIETHALEQSLVFIKTVMSSSDRLSCADGSPTLLRRQPVAAVVGAASSQVSVMVASMLQLFKIPMLSYSSTGVELSEKSRFAFFSRVVPPDNLQAKAMAHLVAQLEWNYVHAIADTGSYGERGMDSFRAAATERGICIDGDIHKISRRWTDDQFKELLLRMRHSNKARGVVMFVDEDNLRRFLTNLKRMITNGSHPELRKYFWFVASDSWGMKTSVIKGFEQIAEGAITIAPKVRFLRGFNDYFGRLGPINTFLSEYWQSMNCSSRINENFSRCFESVGVNFKQEAYVPFVFDAVKLVAKAIHNYIQIHCGNPGTIIWKDCQAAKVGFEGNKLQNFYRNVSLQDNQPPLIDANGDGIGQYSIFQLNRNGTYKTVGRWLAGNRLHLGVDEIRRSLREIDGSKAKPVSVCSWPCRYGFYRAYQDQACCWTCIPCDITTSIILNETSCIQCELGFVPNSKLNACRPIEAVYLRWTSAWAIVPAIFAFCGIVATSFVVTIFVRNNDTPVVMASSRELCYCMLSGIGLCYVMTFILLWRPNAYGCALSRVLIGVSMAAIYAAILVKTNRVARVFKPSSAIRPRFISPSSQVAICVLIVSVQLVGSSIWLIVDPPGVTIQYPTRTEAVLTCKATASHFLISLLFNMFLILACTIYAFKTRKIPENFNETRLIGFTMYSTCILWLAFGPIYFATQNNFKIQITSLCVCISMSGTVALACIFAPKVYIVLWQPYKNVRTRNSAVGKLVNQQMRFISQISSNSAQSLPSGVLTSATGMSVTRKNTAITAHNASVMGAQISVDSAYVTVTGTGSPPNGGTAPSSTATQFDDMPLLCSQNTHVYGATSSTFQKIAENSSIKTSSSISMLKSEANVAVTKIRSNSILHQTHHPLDISQESKEIGATDSSHTQFRQLSAERRLSTSERDEKADQPTELPMANPHHHRSRTHLHLQEKPLYSDLNVVEEQVEKDEQKLFDPLVPGFGAFTPKKQIKTQPNLNKTEKNNILQKTKYHNDSYDPSSTVYRTRNSLDEEVIATHFRPEVCLSRTLKNRANSAEKIFSKYPIRTAVTSSPDKEEIIFGKNMLGKNYDPGGPNTNNHIFGSKSNSKKRSTTSIVQTGIVDLSVTEIRHDPTSSTSSISSLTSLVAIDEEFSETSSSSLCTDEVTTAKAGYKHVENKRLSAKCCRKIDSCKESSTLAGRESFDVNSQNKNEWDKKKIIPSEMAGVTAEMEKMLKSNSAIQLILKDIDGDSLVTFL